MLTFFKNVFTSNLDILFCDHCRLNMQLKELTQKDPTRSHKVMPSFCTVYTLSQYDIIARRVTLIHSTYLIHVSQVLEVLLCAISSLQFFFWFIYAHLCDHYRTYPSVSQHPGISPQASSCSPPFAPLSDTVTSGKRKIFSINSAGKNEQPHEKMNRKKLNSCFTANIKLIYMDHRPKYWSQATQLLQ